MGADASGIAVVILTQNSVRTLRRTLDSVREFDEIIVMDGGSLDETEAIARSYDRVRFLFEPFPGFAAQRNNALRHVRHDWVLVVDSDEEVTPPLRARRNLRQQRTSRPPWSGTSPWSGWKASRASSAPWPRNSSGIA